jgi:hypothetical protein
MKIPIVGLLILMAGLMARVVAGEAGTPEQVFQQPPRAATPWVYWMWLRTPTTPAAMTLDLEAMKAKGITGFILYDNGAGGMEKINRKMVLREKAFVSVPTDDFKGEFSTPLPVLPTWSAEWRQEIRFVARESKRLGLDFCLTIGLAGCSAPGLDPHYAEQQLIWSSREITGPTNFDGALPLPLPAKKSKNYEEMSKAYRDVAVLAVPIKDHLEPADVQDISAQMDAAGHLHWAAPDGRWRILRFGQMPIGITNPWGLFCDHLSAEAFDQNWALTMAPLLKVMTPEERGTMKYVEDDSWEAGHPTWTKTFPKEFQKRRGYRLTNYLPILAGQKFADDATAERFKRDYALTISDLELENYYSHMKSVCNANGLTLYAEANGPNYNGIDVAQSGFHVDHDMGEFWMPSAHRPNPAQRFLTRDAVSVNHLKGDPITLCEAFTSVAPLWSETPFSMKACADQAFCDGVNRLCIHNYSHSPSLDAKPGDVYFAGTIINRNITWWNETPAFFDYLSRCCALLQQGTFVADALFYIGDGINQAAPMKAIYPTLGPGYDYDRADATALIKLAGVKDGRIVLTTGMTYRLLILPAAVPMSLAGLQKIASLVEAGATVVGPRPTGLAGLSPNPEVETQFNNLVTKLWGTASTDTAGGNAGLGHIYENQTAHEVLADEGVPRDFDYEGLSAHGEIDWIHRSTADAEIYYVASRWFAPETVTGKFRVTGRQPELWDPVTGKMRDATAFQQQDGQTIIPLEFDPCGSVFVVFRKPIASTLAGTATGNYATVKNLGELSGPWTVTFDPQWGGPAQPVTFEALTDWTQRPEPGIKYYSGTAFYIRKFDLPSSLASGQRLLLDLGDVHEVASVQLNGQDLGVVWAKPARVDITSTVKAAGNELKIKVINLWPNRLIGDSSLPPEKQFTKTNMRNYTPNSPLLPSGLLGPVSLLAAETPLPK